MTAAILPFKSVTLRPLTLSPVSLRGAYADDDVRTFVQRLRQLAALAPDRCGPMLRLLDDVLAGIVEDFARGGELSEMRATVLSPEGAYRWFLAVSELSEPERRAVGARLGELL
jgi:hypothetical protein